MTAQVFNRILIFTEIEHTCFPIDCFYIDIPTSSVVTEPIAKLMPDAYL